MSDLLEAINEYYHAEGHYPVVKVNPVFGLQYKSNYEQLAKLVWNDGVDVQIDDNLNQDWELV